MCSSPLGLSLLATASSRRVSLAGAERRCQQNCRYVDSCTRYNVYHTESYCWDRGSKSLKIFAELKHGVRMKELHIINDTKTMKSENCHMRRSSWAERILLRVLRCRAHVVLLSCMRLQPHKWVTCIQVISINLARHGKLR